MDPLPSPPDFRQAAAALGVEFDPGDVDRLGRYLALLLDANTRFNLTAITDPDQAWERHILDSLTLLPPLSELGDDARVIDVGSGGGLPGIPLAITMPTLQFTLLEATGKKARFLEEAVRELRIENATVLGARAEEAAHHRGAVDDSGGVRTRHGGLRESFDAAIARAVGRLAVLAELTIPFVRVGGLALLVKGAKADEELAEASRAIGLLGARHAQTIPTPTGKIVVLEKRSATPKTYPRRSGEPARAPLGVPR